MKLLIGAILQARMSSSRLPGKVMKVLDGKNPLIYYVIEQMKNCKKVDKVIVATSDNKEDDVIEKFVSNLGIDCFRGKLNDVLDRYYKCAKKFKLSTIVRITCDNPLIDPSIVDNLVSIFQETDNDLVVNIKERTFPHGTEVEIFSFDALEKAWKSAKLPSEKEHVTPFFYNNLEKFKILNIKNERNLSHLRWTVDREDDFDLVSKLVVIIKKRPILMSDILDTLEKNPQLKMINQNHNALEGYKKSLDEDKT
jgi:spore coat polysaccharide biosynthesis protein SpsF